uniref:Pectate lyase n=1 Tax=Salix viminalis TaxID=40686 RepID=A0A6N2M8D6_SALVM
MGGSIKRSFCWSSKLRLFTWFFSVSLPLLFSTISPHRQIFLQRERREKLTMVVSRKWACVFSAVLLLLLVGVAPATSRTNAGISAPTRRIEIEKVQSSSNSTMAARSQEEADALNEKAVADDPEEIVSMVEMSIRNSTERRRLGYFSCGTGNPIDDCWRCDPNWEKNRKRLADCGIGFGRNAIGGRDGRFYVVTDPGDDDPVNPRPGTLRHAVIQDAPLWIVFKRDMVIQLKQELIMNSFKTIDGRGVNVHIANGGCITIQFVTNVIVHGLHIHDCKPTGNAMVRSSPSHYGWRTMADGDAISIFGSSHVWVDHNSLSNCADGLVDAVMGSTAITVSNNHFTHHNEVILLGHSDSYTRDKLMQVTIAYNHFGEGLIQRMPRCRHGYFHVVNNDYTHWEMYAIGGSAEPTINSQGNRYNAPANPFAKEVTKRVDTNAGYWKNWNWRSEGDLLLNGAYFTPSGAGASSSYARASSLGAKSSTMVGTMTANAGALGCRRARQC